MADGTKIEWAEATWNPIRAGWYKGDDAESWRSGTHCEILTPGCEHCYAQGINKRWGTGLPYLRTARDKLGGIFLDEKILQQPLHWQKPRRIFPCSMTDMFGEWVPDEMLDRVWAIMALCRWHTFLVLTKRTGRMRDYVAAANPRIRDICYRPERYFSPAHDPTVGRVGKWPDRWSGWPLPNVWVGGSVEDQRRADERIPDILATPAAVRWISAEPLLEGIDFRQWQHDFGCPCGWGGDSGHDHCIECGWKGEALGDEFGPGDCPECKKPLVDYSACPECGRASQDGMGYGPNSGPRLNWVVVGGESGPGARPFDIEWARSIIKQCKAAGVACFVKQLGAHTLTWREGFNTGGRSLHREGVKLRDRKGGDPGEWPSDLRVREYPEARA